MLLLLVDGLACVEVLAYVLLLVHEKATFLLTSTTSFLINYITSTTSNFIIVLLSRMKAAGSGSANPCGLPNHTCATELINLVVA